MTDWGKIHLLESRLAWHRGHANYMRNRLKEWTLAGQRAHYWHNRHSREHKNKAVAKDNAAIERARAEIRKWKAILDPEEIEIHHLEVAINQLKPKQQEWLAGGWVRPGTPFRMQRQDMGQDFEIPLFDSIVAPGSGYCTGWASDRPFPNGFGNPYATVHINDGRFGGNDWYLGHANEPIIRPGESFHIGQPLARLNNSLNSGWGWCELGHLPYGSMSEGERWHYLFSPIWR